MTDKDPQYNLCNVRIVFMFTGRGFGRVINAGVFEPEFRGYILNCAFDSHQPNTLDQAHADLGHTIARDTIN